MPAGGRIHRWSRNQTLPSVIGPPAHSSRTRRSVPLSSPPDGAAPTTAHPNPTSITTIGRPHRASPTGAAGWPSSPRLSGAFDGFPPQFDECELSGRELVSWVLDSFPGPQAVPTPCSLGLSCLQAVNMSWHIRTYVHTVCMASQGHNRLSSAMDIHSPWRGDGMGSDGVVLLHRRHQGDSLSSPGTDFPTTRDDDHQCALAGAHLLAHRFSVPTATWNSVARPLHRH